MRDKKIKPELEDYLAIVRAVAGQLDFKKVLEHVAREVEKILPHDHMDVTIIIPDDRSKHVPFEVGMATDWVGGDEPQLISTSPIKCLLRGEIPSILTADAWTDPRFHFEGAFDSPIFDARLHSRVHVPLHVHGTIQGSLNISSHRIGFFDIGDVAIAQIIADLIAPYFYALMRGQQAEKSALAEGAARGRAEALRQGALRLTEGMERERKRLGMELHDQTLADLTRIYRQLNRFTRRANIVGQELTQLGEATAQCTRELRRIIEDAKPGILELFGFSQAVEAQLERSVTGTRVPIRTRVTDQTDGVLDRGPEPVRTALFRIVQEAVNNAVKHGNCDHINVDIRTSGAFVKITVADNGSGPKTGWDQSSGGIENMRIRAALISAELRFESFSGDEITRITILVPTAEIARPTGAQKDFPEQHETKRDQPNSPIFKEHTL